MSGVVAGRYRLDIVIGSGGMGTVWRGYDEMLHRPVAIKELHLPAQLGDTARAEAVARAFTEARHAARLQHPGIVSVYDIAEHDGRPWIVMQLVEGVSLYQRVRQHGPMPPVEAARIGIAVLDALAAAHAAGVVHRDVKPSNVLLGPRGEVLLTDFSIAFAIGAVTMTNTGVVLGSPGYVAPERVSGGKTGPATDLFGLGATLFFLVEGVGPFDNEEPLAALLASATQPHPRPRNGGPITPVIDGLLAKDPAQRMTALTAAGALAAIAGRTPGAPVPWPAARPGRAHSAAPAPAAARKSLPGGGPPHHAGPPRTQPRPALPPQPVRSGGAGQRWRTAHVLAAGAVLILLVAGGLFLALRPKPGASAAHQPTSTRSLVATGAVLATGMATPSTDPTGPATTGPAPTAAAPTAAAPTTAAPTTAAPTTGGQPTGGDNPPVIDSVTVAPSTVCYGRFTVTVVAHDDSGEMTAGYEYTIQYPDGTGERWGGGLSPGPNNTWTAEVGRPGDNGLFAWAGSTIQGFVSVYDGVNTPPTTMNFPISVNVVSC
jgi:hypothetical protein